MASNKTHTSKTRNYTWCNQSNLNPKKGSSINHAIYKTHISKFNLSQTQECQMHKTLPTLDWSQTSSLNSPSPFPRGTTAATLEESWSYTCAAAASSKPLIRRSAGEIERTPHPPSTRRAQVGPTPQPRGVTRPRPVTTTRRRGGRGGGGKEWRWDEKRRRRRRIWWRGRRRREEYMAVGLDERETERRVLGNVLRVNGLGLVGLDWNPIT